MSDYAQPRFGTPDQSPFDFLKKPRSVVELGVGATKNRSTKMRLQAIIERRGHFNVVIANQASSDRTNSIARIK